MKQPLKRRMILAMVLFTPSTVFFLIAIWLSTGGPFRHTRTAIQYDQQVYKDLRTRNFEGALAMARLAVNEDSHFAHTRYCLGMALYYTGHYDEAIRELQAANSLSRGDGYPNGYAAAYYFLGYAQSAVGKQAEAKAAWKMVLKYPQGQMAQQAQTLLDAGDKPIPTPLTALPPDA